LRGWRGKFTEEPVLAVLDLDKKIRIEVDASDYATERVLSIEYEYRRWRPVAIWVVEWDGIQLLLWLKTQRQVKRGTLYKFYTRELNRCYDLKLSSDCNLGKGLSKSEEWFNW